MTDEPSQLPWHLEGKCIYTAHGDFIGEMEHTDDARLVVAAVNERDHLRNIVKRIEEEMERCHRRDGGISQELMDAVYEAHAAIGEEGQSK